MSRILMIGASLTAVLLLETIEARATCDVSCFAAKCWRAGSAHYRVVNPNEDCLREWNYDQDFGYIACPTPNSMKSIEEVDTSAPVCTSTQFPFVNPGPYSSCGSPIGEPFDYACCPTCTIRT